MGGSPFIRDTSADRWKLMMIMVGLKWDKYLWDRDFALAVFGEFVFELARLHVLRQVSNEKMHFGLACALQLDGGRLFCYGFPI